MLTQLPDRYAEAARADAELRGAAAGLVLPPTYEASYGGLMLPQPIFADHGEITGFAADLAVLFETLTSLPARFFDGDVRRYSAALGMDDRIAELMRLGSSTTPTRYARADAYHDGDSFKLLELNVGSELGGIDSAQVNRAFLDVPAFRDFAEANGLAFVDTCEHLASSLRRAGREVGADQPVVALIEGRGGLTAHRHVFAAIAEAMRGHGVELLLGEIGELEERGRKLSLDGTPLDVVLRYFSAAEVLADPAGPEALARVMRAHLHGKTVLFTPLEAGFFASKGSFGLLHDPSLRERLEPAELEVIDRVVPWTRVLSGSDRSAAQDRDGLIEYCREHREGLVLKPGVGYGAEGVVMGAHCSDAEWAEALLAAKEKDYAVQQLVVPAAEPVIDPATGAEEDWRANWGVFVTEQGYGGAFVRSLKAQDGSVISYSNPGTRGACVFTGPVRAAGAPEDAVAPALASDQRGAP